MSSVTRRVVSPAGTTAAAARAGDVWASASPAAKPAPLSTPTATAPALLRIRKSRRVSCGRAFSGAPVSAALVSVELGQPILVLSAMGISLFQNVPLGCHALTGGGNYIDACG